MADENYEHSDHQNVDAVTAEGERPTEAVTSAAEIVGAPPAEAAESPVAEGETPAPGDAEAAAEPAASGSAAPDAPTEHAEPEPEPEPAEQAEPVGEAASAEAQAQEATSASAAGEAAPAAAEKAQDAAAEPVAQAAPDGAEAQRADAPAEPEKPAEPAAAAVEAEPEKPTAVTLGLLPEKFVSAPSTALHFYAPTLTVLPALPREDADDSDDDEDFDDAGSRGGRRRRRRGGKGQREREPELITEPQAIKGSTRLEAKKQRRRDGREAGRRRSVVTEAEFLARRESVDRQMVVRSKQGRVQIGVLEDKVLVEHYVARDQDASLIGNVYLGRVQNVLPSMEAAFVDIGRGRNAVLYSGEVDWDSVETGNQPRRIELALKPGDKVLVQVTKDPVGHKGARLTSQISLPGRYLVYVPNGSMNGISRKLPDTERARLKKILKQVLPSSSGVIVRTAAEGATEDQLTRDVSRLTSQWEHIQRAVEKGSAPSMLHSEPDLLVKIVRDVFNEDFTKMVIQGDDAHETISTYLEQVAPDLLTRVERYEGERDPFDEYRVTEQIEKALDRKVWLPSGGSLVIDRTEAMTVIDVNTGKFVGTGGNLEETVTKNNLEAAEEIVRQMRLRDMGGIIVVDFIDMVLESNRDLVLRRLVECLSRDRTKHQVAEVTSLGLVQMTRKKLGLGLLETFSEACEACAGRGAVVHHEPVLKQRSSGGNGGGRRGRGQNGGSNDSGSNNGRSKKQSGGEQHAGGATHTITDGVKSALAQIAASTIPPHHDEGAEAPSVSESSAAKDPSVEIALPDGPRAEAEPDDRQKRPRRKRTDRAERGDRADRVPSRERAPERPKSEKEQLLDSVLSALPEPKEPGQGRNRTKSRRVTTAALTGGTATNITRES
ncbi:Rne/Rng family ribonuclease [Microbacterium halophytorum]|uniref:Rne/Rng family ribonuclease n=1 Tax=Microbacterium halophytorum TaxID=2067568 RepID=UPI001E28FF31|nr:Rne/Rng family ribonuclease [Microbacterium halophytorum]